MRVAVDELVKFCEALLRAHGLSDSHARDVADCLVNADLWGLDSHGVSRLPIYLERLQRRVVNATPRLSSRSNAPAVAMVDGDNGPGAVVGAYAMREAIRLASSSGVGVVTARNSNHYGAAGHYARMAVSQGCIGMSGTNAPITMAAWGAREPALGTNPLAVAAPAGRYGMFALDMSSSVVAKGRILAAMNRGEPIPAGWAIDVQGRPTTDARAAWEGVVLPFAGPKGSGFAMFIEMMSGALAGAAIAGTIADQYTEFGRPQGVGHFFIALRISAFMPQAEFAARMESLIEQIKSRRAAEGVDAILFPGEIESDHERVCRRTGVPLDPGVMGKLAAHAAAVGVPLPRTF